MINRDRKMPTDYIRNGVLYVTEKYVGEKKKHKSRTHIPSFSDYEVHRDISRSS